MLLATGDDVAPGDVREAILEIRALDAEGGDEAAISIVDILRLDQEDAAATDKTKLLTFVSEKAVTAHGCNVDKENITELSGKDGFTPVTLETAAIVKKMKSLILRDEDAASSGELHGFVPLLHSRAGGEEEMSVGGLFMVNPGTVGTGNAEREVLAKAGETATGFLSDGNKGTLRAGAAAAEGNAGDIVAADPAVMDSQGLVGKDHD